METQTNSEHLHPQHHPSFYPFPVFSLVHHELKGYLDIFESKLIGIGLVSKEIKEHQPDQEIENGHPLRQRSWIRFSFKRIKTFLVSFLFLMTFIRHCVTISWYVFLPQEGNMSTSIKLISSGNLYRCFGSLVVILFSGGFSFGSYFIFVQNMVFVWAEKKDMLHSLYTFYPSNEATQEKLKLSEENMSFITKTFKFAVRLEGMANYLIVIPSTIMLLSLLSLSLYQDHDSFSSDLMIEMLISFPNIVSDILHVFYGSHQIISVQIIVFINSLYPILRIEQLIKERLSFIENGRLFDSMNQLHQDINQVYDMILKRNFMVKYLVKNAVIACSPMIGILLLFFFIECPALIKLVIFSVCFNFVGLNVTAIYFLGKTTYISRRLYGTLHTIYVHLTRKVSSRQRLVSLKTNLNLMKMISSRRKPFGFTFPDEQLVTPLTAFSFLGSTVSFTLMILGNKMFRDVMSF